MHKYISSLYKRSLPMKCLFRISRARRDCFNKLIIVIIYKRAVLYISNSLSRLRQLFWFKNFKGKLWKQEQAGLCISL